MPGKERYSFAWFNNLIHSIQKLDSIYKFDLICFCSAAERPTCSTSLGKKTLKLCQCDSSFDSELCFDSEIRLAFENRFGSERVVVQSCPDLNDDAYSDYPELNESLFQSCNLNWVTV